MTRRNGPIPTDWASFQGGAPQAVRDICARFSQIGLSLNERLGRAEAVAAAAWDSPDYLKDLVDSFEADMSAAATDLRNLVDRMQTKRERFVKDAKDARP